MANTVLYDRSKSVDVIHNDVIPYFVECRKCFFMDPNPALRGNLTARGPMERVLVPTVGDINVLGDDSCSSYKLVYPITCGHRVAL